jgi:hypothetical protein
MEKSDSMCEGLDMVQIRDWSTVEFFPGLSRSGFTIRVDDPERFLWQTFVLPVRIT